VLLVALGAANSFIPLFSTPRAYDYNKYEGLVTQAPYTPYQTKPGKQKDSLATPDNKLVQQSRTEPIHYNKQVTVIDINTADSLALLDVKGIGPAFAGRIVKYRNLLGGFVKKEQLMEVYGLDKEKYDGIKNQVKVSAPHTTINLNNANYKQLSKHPYIKSNLTKAIFALKKKLGTFKTVDDIKQIDLVTDELYNKLAPYLTVE
jgi:DNA uptake protein ComE-like DNA-binding protein